MVGYPIAGFIFVSSNARFAENFPVIVVWLQVKCIGRDLKSVCTST